MKSAMYNYGNLKNVELPEAAALLKPAKEEKKDKKTFRSSNMRHQCERRRRSIIH
jgi:hypothetical protein